MKRTITIILMILLAGLILLTGVCNWITNEDFFEASITQILTLAITLSIAFWATQYKADMRKMKEHAEDVLSKVQLLVSDMQFYSIPKDGDKEVISKQINAANRKINNYISILEEYAKTLKFKKEIKYIHAEFNTYKDRVGEHINDLDYLAKSEDEFKRIAENIDSKCEYIILKLYK